jgi:DNA-binding MarR family transcriptional regulator
MKHPASPSADDCTLMNQSCLSLNLRWAARNVTRHYEQALEKASISATQLPIVAAVHAMEMPSLATLAENLDLERSTVSREVKILVRDGLLELTPGRDGRTKEVHLTRKGVTTLARAIPLWKEAHAELQEMIGEERVSTGIRFARKVARATGATGNRKP